MQGANPVQADLPGREVVPAGGGGAAPLGQAALGGAMWSVLQTVASKAFALASQFILAGVLLDTDYALVAMTILVASFASLFQQIGLGEMLVRQHHRFARVAPATLALALCTGLMSLVITMGVSPLAGLIFAAPELKGLLLVAAVGLPFDALTVIPQASMRIRMQFRKIAILGTTNVLATAILSVTFAFLQMGAYSVVLPRPIVSIGTCVATFVLSGLPLRLHFRMKLWRRFLRNARYFFITGGLNTLLAQGDYLLTGLFFPKAILGAYYFAFNLSTQTVQLISANLSGVLLPSFAKIDSDRSRQLAAYLKVCSAIMLVGVLACLLQAALAHPLLRLVYAHKWDAAIPLFQILSVGMMFILPAGPGIVILSAQGRYRLLAVWTGVTTAAFLLAVVAGALSGSVVGIALAVASFFLVFGPLGVVIPVYENRRQAAEFLGRVYFKPVLVGAVSTACGALAGAGLYLLTGWLEASFVAAGAVLAGVYLVLLATVLKRESEDLLSRLRPLVARFGRARAGGEERV